MASSLPGDPKRLLVACNTQGNDLHWKHVLLPAARGYQVDESVQIEDFGYRPPCLSQLTARALEPQYIGSRGLVNPHMWKSQEKDVDTALLGYRCLSGHSASASGTRSLVVVERALASFRTVVIWGADLPCSIRTTVRRPTPISLANSFWLMIWRLRRLRTFCPRATAAREQPVRGISLAMIPLSTSERTCTVF